MSRTYEQLEPVISALDNRISANAEQIATDAEDISQLKSDLTDTGLIESVPFNSENDGHYISSQWGVGSSKNFSMTDPFLLKKDCKLTFKASGYLGNVAVIAAVNNDGTYTALVVDDGSTDVKEYTYTADYDRNIVLSYKIASEHIATIIYNAKEAIDGLEDTIESYGIEYDVDFSQIKNGYVGSTGYLNQSENFCYTDPFRLIAGETITVTARGYLAYVAMISEYDESSRYGYKPLVISIDSTVREYSYTAVKDIDIVLSFSKNYTHTAKVSLNIKDAIVESKPNNIPDYMQLFPRMAVIGDSLSSGELVINSVATDIYGDSWLSFIAKKTNASARTHYSVGGLTAKGWIETYLSKMQSDDPFNAYFVALGTNDNYSHPYDIGTISDVAGSNTFVGYYKQIIEAVRTKAPNSAIFCVSLYNNGEAHHTYSDMIESIAELYDNCFYLDFINKSKIFTSTNGVWSASSHFTTLGYKYVADIIYNLVCEVVDKNKEFFKWFGKYNSVGGQFEE